MAARLLTDAGDDAEAIVAEINVTPLTDIFLVLLIIFMVTSTALVQQAHGAHHQYPDGFMLFLGTMFAPVQDRGQPGNGFTHKVVDSVRIRSAKLGMLVNTVQHCDRIAPWTFGLRALFSNLAGRGLLASNRPGQA